MEIRHDWTRAEIRDIYSLPLPELIFQAQSLHRKFHRAEEVQFCRLLSIKTGACPEDCAYCSQSAHYQTDVVRQKLMRPAEVLESARRAKADGATRFCMGAAWRQAPEGKEFEDVLEMVRGVAEMGLEACCTLGMLTSDQALHLKEAGLTAYNHNLDTSPEFYGQIITTRIYADRIRTIENVRKAGITVCCGGILGLGEAEEDRIGLLEQLANFDPHPESVPINVLARIPGTPLADAPPLDAMIFVRMIATARILMPAARVRLSGGRHTLSRETIALCFLAGANSIFTGERLLTTPNPPVDQDKALLAEFGMRPMQNA